MNERNHFVSNTCLLLGSLQTFVLPLSLDQNICVIILLSSTELKLKIMCNLVFVCVYDYDFTSPHNSNTG
jgi:hypothetical protein